MANCQVCGAPGAEVTVRPYDGATGNWHTDCALLDDYVFQVPTSIDFGFGTTLAQSQTRRSARHVTEELPAAPTVATAAGTTLGIGAYNYAVTFVDASGGESMPGTQAPLTTTSNNQAGSLTAIPTGPTGTTKRNIYRTAVGGTQLKLLHQIADNTTTTYSDSTADGSLGANAPTVSTFLLQDFP